jgi:hypothetical protein
MPRFPDFDLCKHTSKPNFPRKSGATAPQKRRQLPSDPLFIQNSIVNLSLEDMQS